MKKILFFLILALAFVSCKKDEPTTPKPFEIDMTSKVYIKPGLSTEKSQSPYARVSSNPKHLSPLEIVKQGNALHHRNDTLGPGITVSGFAGKDTTSAEPAFLRRATDILAKDGFDRPMITPDFIYAYDCVIAIRDGNIVYDTIAYIPNANMRLAEKNIKQALADKDTASVYGLFQDAFKFLPITGEEYLELKKQNLN